MLSTVQLTCPAMEDMKTILPCLLSIISGKRACVGCTLPSTFTRNCSWRDMTVKSTCYYIHKWSVWEVMCVFRKGSTILCIYLVPIYTMPQTKTLQLAVNVLQAVFCPKCVMSIRKAPLYIHYWITKCLVYTHFFQEEYPDLSLYPSHT